MNDKRRFIIYLHDERCCTLDHRTSYISPNINIMGWSKEDKHDGYTVRLHGANSDKKSQESGSHSANE